MATSLSQSPSSGKENTNPLLILVSHAHAPPLVPPPDLKYDLRTVPNPPKAIRDSYTGVDKRLREHMLQHDAFLQMLGRAEADIKEKMAKYVAEIGIDERNESTERKEKTEDGIGDYKESEVDDDKEDINVKDDRAAIRVGVFCARGQHRSVAFVEELARREWPTSWELQVWHRDLGKEKGGGNGRKERGKRGGKVREIDVIRFSDE
jgi:RNase adaptor protein for sRNA GlmZ degradation